MGQVMSAMCSIFFYSHFEPTQFLALTTSVGATGQSRPSNLFQQPEKTSPPVIDEQPYPVFSAIAGSADESQRMTQKVALPVISSSSSNNALENCESSQHLSQNKNQKMREYAEAQRKYEATLRRSPSCGHLILETGLSDIKNTVAQMLQSSKYLARAQPTLSSPERRSKLSSYFCERMDLTFGDEAACKINRGVVPYSMHFSLHVANSQDLDNL